MTRALSQGNLNLYTQQLIRTHAERVAEYLILTILTMDPAS